MRWVQRPFGYSVRVYPVCVSSKVSFDFLYFKLNFKSVGVVLSLLNTKLRLVQLTNVFVVVGRSLLISSWVLTVSWHKCYKSYVRVQCVVHCSVLYHYIIVPFTLVVSSWNSNGSTTLIVCFWILSIMLIRFLLFPFIYVLLSFSFTVVFYSCYFFLIYF